MRNYLIIFATIAGLTSLTADKPHSLSGTVYGLRNKTALQGVTIKAIGAVNTTQTDAKGRYTIAAIDAKTQLVFSSPGYLTDTITPGDKKTLDVYLKNIPSLNIYAGKGNGTSGKNKNARTDDLIKQIEVDSNGAIIKKGNANVTVRINGKDFTGNNVNQAVKNLPANVLEKIEAVNDYKSSTAPVIRGYVKRDRAYGSSYIVPGKEVEDHPVANVEQLLQGKVQGLNIQNNTGAPGMRGSVNIRGLQPVDGATKTALAYTNNLTPAPGNEDYDRIVENQFTDPKATPLSTFAVDVDKASYANIRRFINGGQLPPKNAVRIEELINYFNYNLPEPSNGDPVAIQTELATAPWNNRHQLVRIGLKAKDVKTDKLPASNLVFLVDVSGSMSDANKLPLVKTSLKMLVNQLRPIDHVALVTYAGYVGIALESTPADQKEKIKEAIDRLGAGGGTAGGAGLMMAYQVAQKNFIKKGNNRIVMATDGDFNVGASSNKDMEDLIEEERKTGISLSILGFGMGNYKDSKIELLADKGHGNYAYIDNITEATKSMVTEFGGTLFTVAKDVKIQVEFNPAKVQAYRLLGYENRLMAKEDFNNDTKLGGEMGVNHTVTALYEIIPVGVNDNFIGSVDPLKYQKPTEVVKQNTSNELMTVKFRYKTPESEKSEVQTVTLSDKPANIGSVSDDFRFAAAVAEYGMILRNSAFKQNADFKHLIKMAKDAKGKDDNGYRAEFIRLAESTSDIMKTMEVTAAK
jgi:Ca-activated chloride channel family protein